MKYVHYQLGLALHVGFGWFWGFFKTVKSLITFNPVIAHF